MYDLIVVGAGLHALTLLCALLEDHPMADHLVDAEKGIVRSKLNERTMRASLKPRLKTTGIKLAVIDRHGCWLKNWMAQFQTLDIASLRSNAGLHPDPIDPEMLFEFVRNKDYAFDEAFVELTEIPRGKQFVGPFQLPTIDVFNAFCESLIDRYGLREAVIHGRAISIESGSDGEARVVTVRLNDGRQLKSHRVVAAIGHTDAPNMPDWFDENSFLPASVVHTWELVHQLPNNGALEGCTLVVVGGGLTAIQTVLLAIRKGCSKVYLLTRCPLNVRPFDSDLSWSGRLRYQRLRAFWKEPDFEKRIQSIREARRGGTVTQSARSKLQEIIDEGLCEFLEEVEIWDVEQKGDRLQLELSNDTQLEVDRIWLATGSSIDITREQLFTRLMSSHPVRSCGGYPILTEDLKWHPDVEVYVIGAYASLLLGPDGINLAGARRAAFKLRRLFKSAMDGHS